MINIFSEFLCFDDTFLVKSLSVYKNNLLLPYRVFSPSTSGIYPFLLVFIILRNEFALDLVNSAWQMKNRE